MSLDAMKQALALICSARLCEINSMSSRQEMLRLMIEATDTLRAAIEHAERPQTHSEECWRWHHECAVAQIKRLQEGTETLYAMYEQACQQRDQLMDQQRSQIAAMRGRMQ